MLNFFKTVLFDNTKADRMSQIELENKAKSIKLLLTDCDGVLTDTGVYYSANGEELKRFSIRDGMGVERLRNLANIDVGIITGEKSGSVIERAKKLNIKELHLGIKDKPSCLKNILTRLNLQPHQVAYIGDDYNDAEMLQLVGLAAAPNDAMPEVKQLAHFKCTLNGGHGAFREFAEFIIHVQNQ